MKRCLFILLSGFLAIAVSAQNEEQKRFVLNHFEKGKVLYTKENQATESNFNYETIVERMLFIAPDSTIYELARPDIVSHVIIGSRVFEHVSRGMFYERVNVDNGSFYVRWKSRVVSKNEGPYGSTRGTARIDNITQMSSMGSVYDLRAAGEIKVEANNFYYLKDNNKFKRFDSFDSLTKHFKKHEKEIKTYVKENSFSFRNMDDIKKVVEYSFSLKENNN